MTLTGKQGTARSAHKDWRKRELAGLIPRPRLVWVDDLSAAEALTRYYATPGSVRAEVGAEAVNAAQRSGHRVVARQTGEYTFNPHCLVDGCEALADRREPAANPAWAVAQGISDHVDVKAIEREALRSAKASSEAVTQ